MGRMFYSEGEVQEIMLALMQIKIRGVPVFLVFDDDIERPYHRVYVDSGMGIAHLEFEKSCEVIPRGIEAGEENANCTP